jgi:hypothetical protein
MERFCGILGLSVKSKLHAYETLAVRILRLTQLGLLEARPGLSHILQSYEPLKKLTRGEFRYKKRES